MPKKSPREWPPPTSRQVPPRYVPNVTKPGDKGSRFRQAPLAEPKAERQFLALLGTNGVVVLMGALLAAVVVVMVVLLVVKR